MHCYDRHPFVFHIHCPVCCCCCCCCSHRDWLHWWLGVVVFILLHKIALELHKLETYNDSIYFSMAFIVCAMCERVCAHALAPLYSVRCDRTYFALTTSKTFTWHGRTSVIRMIEIDSRSNSRCVWKHVQGLTDWSTSGDFVVYGFFFHRDTLCQSLVLAFGCHYSQYLFAPADFSRIQLFYVST